MTTRRLTPEEIQQANAETRQWRLSVLTLGIIPKPPVRTSGSARTSDRELEAG